MGPGRSALLGLLFLLTVLLPARGEAFCFEEAGEMYDVPPGLLWAIAKVESGFDPLAVCVNRNGSVDFGVMQINSCWEGQIDPQTWDNLEDPCTNVKVGARILAECIDRLGYTWEGIGCYNAISTDKRAAYARKVLDVVQQMRQQTARQNDQP
ncbi:MAG: murein transglycosylase [Desulfuromonas sp.]|uniref:lytic transglycosylase domain-containing protein n=1 Tax=Desulfuromonas sp. TaxID=892 RepID=UPI000CC29F31|nr:lytic transglycosylase domain-containing protein [Desulfuromonas sp.]PLX82393.1 MAG: murein transglycosylase [Desulfuromonas sp.]